VAPLDWLFSTSTKGAEASAAVFSLIETAKSNKLNPYDYIEFILDYLPQQDLVEDPKKLIIISIQSTSLNTLFYLALTFPLHNLKNFIV